MRARRKKNLFCSFAAIGRTVRRRRGASPLRTRRFVTGRRRESDSQFRLLVRSPLRWGTRRVHQWTRRYVAPRLQSQKSVVGFSASRPRVRVHGISHAEEGRSPPPVCALRTGMSCVRAIASELLTPIDTCENLPSLVWLALNLSSPLDARRRATRRPPATTRVQ